MTKQQALIQLLERRDDLLGLTGSHGGYEGDNLRILSHAKNCRLHTAGLRCTCWQQSLAELDRALRALKARQPVHHAHLIARYVQAEHVRRSVRWKDRGWIRQQHERISVSPFGAEIDGPYRQSQTPRDGWYDCTVTVWRPWVDLLIVAQALDMLEREYHGEIRLPDDVKEAA